MERVLNYIMMKFVLQNIYNNIKELSDRDLQYKVWIKAEIPNYVSSYEELMNQLLDDNDFEGVITNHIREYKLKEEFKDKMFELNTLLNNYDDTNKTQLEIIKDPAWIIITELAREVKMMWKNSLLYTAMANTPRSR